MNSSSLNRFVHIFTALGRGGSAGPQNGRVVLVMRRMIGRITLIMRRKMGGQGGSRVVLMALSVFFLDA